MLQGSELVAAMLESVVEDGELVDGPGPVAVGGDPGGDEGRPRGADEGDAPVEAVLREVGHELDGAHPAAHTCGRGGSQREQRAPIRKGIGSRQ